MKISDISSISGLPEELGIDKTLAKEEQIIRIKIERKRYGKLMTIIEGINPKMIDVKKLTKYLKSKLACGGTFKNDKIELQGDYRKKIKKLLVGYGFNEEQIEIT